MVQVIRVVSIGFIILCSPLVMGQYGPGLDPNGDRFFTIIISENEIVPENATVNQNTTLYFVDFTPNQNITAAILLGYDNGENVSYYDGETQSSLCEIVNIAGYNSCLVHLGSDEWPPGIAVFGLFHNNLSIHEDEHSVAIEVQICELNDYPDCDGVMDQDEYVSVSVDCRLTPDCDNDGVGDKSDAFPIDPRETADSDNDGVGDNSDAFPNDPNEWDDSDEDGVGDNSDAFPSDPSETTDSDGDGWGDNSDAFPEDANETADSDGDGWGDNSDAFPEDANETADSDNDGVGDNADTDDDNDLLTDAVESEMGTDPFLADTDGDGWADSVDAFPLDSERYEKGRLPGFGIASALCAVLLAMAAVSRD